jgi:hypothetical protein
MASQKREQAPALQSGPRTRCPPAAASGHYINAERKEPQDPPSQNESGAPGKQKVVATQTPEC